MHFKDIIIIVRGIHIIKYNYETNITFMANKDNSYLIE